MLTMILKCGSVAASAKYCQKKKENADDVHVKNKRCEDVLLWTQLILPSTHHQLDVICKELKVKKHKK